MPKNEPRNVQVLGAAALIAALLTFATGCAKIADPQPPLVRIPKPAADLSAYQRSDFIMLTVTKPTQNTDGSKATTLAGIDVFRLNEQAGQGGSEKPLPAREFNKRAALILSIPAGSFSKYMNGDSIVIEDPLSLPDKSSIYSTAFRYAVAFINKKKEAAGLSNQVIVAPVPIPSPPPAPSAEVKENFIDLKWAEPSENMDGTKPPRIAGYNIYRAEAPQKIPGTRLNSEPVQKPEFEDHSFQFDKTYYYEVGTVGSAQNPYAESLPSPVCAVEARDVFKPAPPENFNAIMEDGSIILLWMRSPSTDIAGYRIYRQGKRTGARVLLQKELITVLSFRDTTIEPGDQYEYTIQAVDTHGNESTPVRAEAESQ